MKAEAGDRSTALTPLAAGSTRSEKADAQGGEFPGSVPPNYIKTYDEGRPRT